MFAEDKFAVAQVRNDFVAPVFDRHGLPLVGTRFTDAFAELGRNQSSITIDGRVDLKVVGVDLGDAVVVSAAARHESQVGRLAGKFEVELDDGVVEGGVFKEDSFGFRRINVRPQQRTVTKRELGLKEPAVADRGGVEVV